MGRWSVGSSVRDDIHDEVCERGYDPKRGTFTQYYGSMSSTPACSISRWSGFCPAPTCGSRAHRRDRARAGSRRLRLPLLDRRDRATDCRAARGSSWPAASGSWTLGAQRPRGRGASAVRTARSAWATTSACCRRSTTSAPAAGRQLPAGVQPPDAHRRGDGLSGCGVTNQAGPGGRRTDGGDPTKTVIVGGVEAGASTGLRLRRRLRVSTLAVWQRPTEQSRC